MKVQVHLATLLEIKYELSYLVPDEAAHYIMLNSEADFQWKIFFVGRNPGLAMWPSVGPERSPSMGGGPEKNLSEASAPAF